MSLYYKIWVDCITKARSIPANHNNWKIYTMIFMSMAMAINFAFIMGFIQRSINYSFYDLDVDVLPGSKLDAFISFFVLYLLPFLVINYVFIFRKNRYEQLIKRYRSNDGKLFIIYFLGSLILPLIFLIVGKIFVG